MRLYFDMVWSWFSLIGYMHCKNFVILIRDQRAPKIPYFVIWRLPRFSGNCLSGLVVWAHLIIKYGMH